MILEEQVKDVTKLYLCDGHGCNMKHPELCYKNGGQCIHTVNQEHSIKKKLGDNFPETIWLNLTNAKLMLEEVNSIHVIQHFKETS